MWRIELGTDEQTGLEADRSFNRGISRTTNNGICSVDFEHECAAGTTPVEEIPGWRGRSAHPQGSRPDGEQSDQRWYSRLCAGACTAELSRLRADAGRRSPARAAWFGSLTRNTA